MEYVTESLTDSGKWYTNFAGEMKVKMGTGKRKIHPVSSSSVGRIRRLRRHPAMPTPAHFNCLMALRLSGLQILSASNAKNPAR